MIQQKNLLWMKTDLALWESKMNPWREVLNKEVWPCLKLPLNTKIGDVYAFEVEQIVQQGDDVLCCRHVGDNKSERDTQRSL